MSEERHSAVGVGLVTTGEQSVEETAASDLTTENQRMSWHNSGSHNITSYHITQHRCTTA
jgi:hypothetical protein